MSECAIYNEVGKGQVEYEAGTEVIVLDTIPEHLQKSIDRLEARGQQQLAIHLDGKDRLVPRAMVEGW